MGRARKIMDNETFATIAEEHGLETKDLLDAANFPLAKIAKLVGAQAEKGGRREKELNFIDACDEAGIIQRLEERFRIAIQ